MNRSLKLRINLQLLSKILFAIYIVYTNVLSFSLFRVQFLSIALLIGATGLELIHDHFRIRIDRSLLAILFFALYALISGTLTAVNYERVLNSTLSLIEWLIVFYLILCYTISDGNPHFSMAVFIIQALSAVSFMLLSGTGLKRLSISESVNVNTLGTTYAFAIAFIMYFLIEKNNKPIKWVISIVAIAALLAGIMLTVSKKAIITGAVLILLWIVLCYRFTFAKLKRIWKIIIFIGVVAVGFYVYRWFTSSYALQVEVFLFRMGNLYVGESDQERIQLIKEGFLVFLQHPFFGVGFNNARFHVSYNTYTHCLYTEVLSCTGLIGTLIFGFALVRPGLIAAKIRKEVKHIDHILYTKMAYLNAIFIVFLLYNFMQITFYAQNLMYVFSVFSAFVVNLYLHYDWKATMNEEG